MLYAPYKVSKTTHDIQNNSPWEVGFLVYLQQVSEQVYKQTFWEKKGQEVNTPQCINHRGVLTTWCILHKKVFLWTNLGQLPNVFITTELITNTNKFSNVQDKKIQNPF